MSRTLPNSTLANDIAFAVFRVAALINFDRLRIELEHAAIELLSYLSEESILKLERLIKLGQDIKEINEVNSQVLLRELGHLYDYLNSAKSADDTVKEDVDLSKEFPVIKERGQFTRPIKDSANLNLATNPATKLSGRVNQQLVMQYLNQTPEFRFKDIQANLPYISSRTLRRIINKLLKQGKLVRIGNPGPSSFYRLVREPSNLPENQGLNPAKPALSSKAPAISASVNPEEKLSTTSNPTSIIAL